MVSRGLWPCPSPGITQNDVVVSIVAALALASPSGPPALPAQDGTAPRISLHWQAPAQCPTRTDVLAALEPLSGAPVTEGGEADLHVEATVVSGSHGYSLTLVLDGEQEPQTRVLDSEDCAVLGRAAAIVVAVALDPVTAASNWPPAPGSEPTPTAAAPNPTFLEPEPSLLEPELDREPRPKPEATPRPRTSRPRTDSALEYGGGFDVSLAGRVLPGLGVGLAIAPYLGTARVHGRLLAQYRPQRTTSLPGNDDAGAQFQFVSGGARICPNAVPTSFRWRVPLCAGFDVGAVIAEGQGAALSRTDAATSLWAAFALEAGATVQIAPRVSLYGAFELAVSLSRPQFFLDNGGLLHQSARLGPRGMLGLQIHRRRDFP